MSRELWARDQMEGKAFSVRSWHETCP